MENYSEPHGGHRDRLRQRMMYEGVDALKSHELLEFLLCYAIPRQDVNDLAHALIESLGSLGAVFSASAERLMEVEGIGEAAVEWILSLAQLGAACGTLRPENNCILKNYADMYAFARGTFRKGSQTCCTQLLMDDTGRVIYSCPLGPMPGWAQPSFLHKAVAGAISLNARFTAIIINAGRRVSYPSNYDRDEARKYAHALSAAGISLMDVLICGSTGVTSLRRLRMLPEDTRTSRRRSLREDYIATLPGFKTRAVRIARLKPGSFYSKSGGPYERTEPV